MPSSAQSARRAQSVPTELYRGESGGGGGGGYTSQVDQIGSGHYSSDNNKSAAQIVPGAVVGL